MKRVLVTGSAGFIGSHLVPELKNAGYEVLGVDRKEGNLEIPGIFTYYADSFKPDVVIHLAANVSRLNCESDFKKSIMSNALMTATIARDCGRRGIKLVYTSTSEVYGDMGTNICREDGPLVIPHNIYGLSKRWGEEASQLYAPRGLLILRPSMTYGPGMHIFGQFPKPGYTAALVTFLWQALHRQPLVVHRGTERSWCWIGDIVRAIRMLVDMDAVGVWNVGRDDTPIMSLRLAEMACDLTGASRNLITEIDPPGLLTPIKRLSTDKLRRIGWKPEIELEEGMRRTLDWVRLLERPE